MQRSSHKKLLKIFIAICILLWTLFPVYWMLTLSVRSSADMAAGFSFYPRSFSFDNFINLFQKKHFAQAIFNSCIVTSVSLALSLAIGLCCSYILARPRFNFIYRRFMIFWVLLVRILPPIAFALPLFIMMTSIGIGSTRLPIILCHILALTPFIIWFMLSFFASLPKEVEESALIDGATEFQLFTKIVLSQVLPGIAAVGILSFMTSWNEYLYGVIFVQSSSQFTIPLALATMNSEQELTQWGAIASGGLVSLIPIILFVLFAQNFLLSGLSNGAVKE